MHNTDPLLLEFALAQQQRAERALADPTLPDYMRAHYRRDLVSAQKMIQKPSATMKTMNTRL